MLLAGGGLWGVAYCLSASEPASPTAGSNTPFLRFREATLGYHGPDGELTNLAEIRIGWFGPTNLHDPLTGDLWWAANFAIRAATEQRPSQGGSAFDSLPVRLIPRWAVDPWGTGVSQLARMIYDQQPLALLGSVDSASTHLAEQVVAKANLPLVSPVATDKSITLAGVPWMFSCAPSDAAIARVLVNDLLAALKNPGQKFAALTCTDHESRMTAREVMNELSRRGRLPDFRFDIPPGAQGVAEQMSALEQAATTVVLIIAGPEDAARLCRAVRERFPAPNPGVAPENADTPRRSGEGGSSCLIIGSHSMGRTRFCELAGPAAEGVRFPLLFAPNPSDTNAARFIEQFTAERRHPPDYAAALTYDATRLLLEAIRRAGPNRAAIREAILGLSPWPGIAGKIQWDGTGQNTRANLPIAAIRSGRIHPETEVPRQEPPKH